MEKMKINDISIARSLMKIIITNIDDGINGCGRKFIPEDMMDISAALKLALRQLDGEEICES